MIITDETDLADWRKAGHLAGKTLAFAKKLVIEDASYLDATEQIEQKIKELGARPAFPPQMSFNAIAAHQCADPNDPITFKEGDVVKIDIGVSVEGAIGDTAGTVVVGGGQDQLLEASNQALKEAIKVIQPGLGVSHIGRVIEDTIGSYGLTPIKNLSGHGLSRYSVHEPPTIPNFSNNLKIDLKENQVIAIEPFATNGAGIVHELNSANIFAQIASKPVRSPYARDLMSTISTFKGLPFTTRWLTRSMSVPKVKLGLRELMLTGVIRQYPPLIDKDKGLVSQHEHTILVRDKPEILTKVED